MSAENVYLAIQEERDRQNAKWGVKSLPPTIWLPVLVEEVGEVARAIMEQDNQAMRGELVQVAAVCIAWLECLFTGD